MSAVVTDQFRIFNATNFIDSVLDSSNSYYVFVGLPNPQTSGFGRDSNWDSPDDSGIIPNPTDNIDYLNHYESTILFGKKITSANIRRVIRRIDWTINTKYEMYRPDYSGINSSPITNSYRLYDSNYYVMNSDYRVYICIDNGSSSNNPTGNASEYEPTFTDLEPVSFNDGYVWKYLYTVSPSDIIKFDSTEYITVPNDWQTSTDAQITAVRENGNSYLNNNQIKKVYIENVGAGYTEGTISCNLVGDGSGGTVSVTVNASQEISDVVVTSGGKNYTYALVDLRTVTGSAVTTFANLVPIIPPSKGHGYDLYTELGADKILAYARFDDSTKDFPTNTKFAQVGIIKNPTVQDAGIGNTVYTQNEFSAVYAMKFDDSPTGTIPTVGTKITQTHSSGKKSVGYVVSYDSETKVLKYIRDRSLYFNGGSDGTNHQDYIGITTFFSSATGTILDFESSAQNVTTTGGFSATIGSFSGITTTVGNKIINLGVTFSNGLAKPEINTNSGDIIYIDNRSLVTRNSRQKEDIKIILEF